MCEYCEKTVHKKTFEFEDPKGTYTRKWYKEIHIVDEMDKNHVSYYGIFSRIHVPDIVPDFDGFYLNSSGNMLVKIHYCPWCGRKLDDEELIEELKKKLTEDKDGSDISASKV